MNHLARAACFALGAACISGLNSFLTKPALSVVGDPTLFTLLKNMVTVAMLGVLIFFLNQAREMRAVSIRHWRPLLVIGIIGGGIPFLLYFIGLSMIPAVTAAFIHKTLFVWVALLATPFLGERIGWLQAFSLSFLLLAVTVFQLPSLHSPGFGEMLVLLATLFWAVENIVAKKLLKQVSPLLAAFARMSIGSLIIFGYAFSTGALSGILILSTVAWLWVLLTGALLTGFVSLWYRALSLAPATFVASLLVPATFITGALSSVFVTQSLSFGNIAGWGALIIGMALLFLVPLPFGKSEHTIIAGRLFWKQG